MTSAVPPHLIQTNSKSLLNEITWRSIRVKSHLHEQPIEIRRDVQRDSGPPTTPMGCGYFSGVYCFYSVLVTNQSSKGNMWSAIPFALLCMIVDWSERKRGLGGQISGLRRPGIRMEKQMDKQKSMCSFGTAA